MNLRKNITISFSEIFSITDSVVTHFFTSGKKIKKFKFLCKLNASNK